jgi:hypothetical protein
VSTIAGDDNLFTRHREVDSHAVVIPVAMVTVPAVDDHPRGDDRRAVPRKLREMV